MSIEAALRSLIVNDTALAALVAARVYPTVLPQGCTYPAIRYSQVSGGDEYHCGGVQDLREESYQLSCVAITKNECVELASAIRSLLSGYTGVSEALNIRLIKLTNQTDGDDVQPGSGDKVRYYRHLNIQIMYKES